MEEKYKKIGGEIGFSYLLTFAQIIFAPFVVALLTRILGTEKYGIYALFAVFIGLFSIVLQPGLSQYLITKIPEIAKPRRPNVFFSIIIFEIIFLLIVLTAFYFSPLSSAFLAFMKLGGYNSLLALSIAIIFFGTIAGIYDNYYRANQHLNLANLMEFIRIKGWALPLFALFLIFKKFSLAQVFLLWGGFTIATLLIYLLVSKKEASNFLRFGRIRYDYVKSALKFGGPIIPASILAWVIVASDRYVLNYYFSASTVGLYALAYSLLGILYTLGMTASGVILPYISEAKVKDRQKFNTLFSATTKYGLMLVVPGIIGVVILRTELVTLLSGPTYLAAAPVVATLMLYPLFAFLSYMGFNCLVLHSRTVLCGGIYALAAGLNFALNLALVPGYGMQGAAVATVVSYFVMAVLTLHFAKAYMAFNYKFIKIPGILISSLVMGVVIYLIHPTNVLSKFLTILGGGGVYFSMIILTKVLEKKELELIKSAVLSVLKYKREDFLPQT